MKTIALINNWINRFKKDKDENVSTENIRVIKTTKKHIKTIHLLEKDCFPDPWSLDSLRYEITHPDSICFVAVNENEKILGHITMRHILNEGHINNIAVAKYARRQGVGQKLLETIIEKSKTLGILSITLEVRTKNHAAISLYEKFGFKTQGIRKNYYHKPADDAFVMWMSERLDTSNQ